MIKQKIKFGFACLLVSLLFPVLFYVGISFNMDSKGEREEMNIVLDKNAEAGRKDIAKVFSAPYFHL